MKQKTTALQYTIYLLSRQDYSQYKITQKLEKREHSPEEIAQVLDYCQQHHYIDDLRYAQVKIRSGLYKGHGWYRIEQGLKQEKIPQETIDEALYRYEQEEGTINWCTLAKEVVQRKYKTPMDSPKEKARRARFLQSRGFSFEQINSALSLAILP